MQKLNVEDRYFPTNKHIRLSDKLFNLAYPKVMGILNITPDSFYKDSRQENTKSLLERTEAMLDEGVDILDIGGYSSRPGAKNITIEEEKERVIQALKAIRSTFPNIPISIDTFRGEVAKASLDLGAAIINDISAFNIDPTLLDVVAQYQCPYILMHMQGTPKTMAQETNYDNLFLDLSAFISHKISILESRGVMDIIVDPGFGFGKTIEQNFQLLNNLEAFHIFNKPILVGISRKSMIYKTLDCTPEEALNGTSILNTIALTKGASILRVHDVKEAKDCILLLNKLKQEVTESHI
jgi:dihydropteroate synthase